jgi:phosphatidylglycerophosphate synthase
MGSPYRLRRIFKPVVVGIAKLFNKVGTHPNHITILMFAISVITCVQIILTDYFWIFGILVFLTGILDGVDGALARISGKSTNFGAFFDSTIDRISEILLYLGLFFNPSFFLYGDSLHQAIILTIIFCSLMISYVRSRAESICDADLDVGVFARSERLFTLFLICAIPIRIVYSIGIILLSVGVIVTMIYRFFYIRKMLFHRQKE